MYDVNGSWTFDIRLGGSRRVGGIYFCPSLDTWKGPWDATKPDWVWLVHWPNPAIQPVMLDPVKRELPTPADVEAFIDANWPMTEVTP